jgi:hypothetical protein
MGSLLQSNLPGGILSPSEQQKDRVQTVTVGTIKTEVP